jgi:hypothetical protein
MMTTEQFAMLKKFQKSLEDDRSRYEDDLRKIARYVVPSRANWSWDEEDVSIRPVVYDATGIHANQKLADGYQGYMVNPRSEWFSLRYEDPAMNKDRKMRDWLSDVAQPGLYKVFARSNWYSAVGQCFADQAFGTVVLYVEKDPETVINFIPQHIKGIYIAEDSHDRIDTVLHKMLVPNRVILKEYRENLEEPVAERLERNPFGKTLLCRSVLPNEEYEEGYIGPKGMRWSSTTYMEEGNDKPLKESGYNVMPYVVWRPFKVTGEAYGRSFAWYALGSILRINQFEKAILEVAHLQAKPPLQLPSELLDQVNVSPWGLNAYTDPSRLIFPMNIGGNLSYGVEEREQLRKEIFEYFNVDAFQLMSMMADKEYTATQAAEMAGEKSAMLTAHTARAGSEFLDPSIQCTLTYSIEAGAIAPPPMNLPPHAIKVDYVGPLTLDQERAFKTSGMMRGLNQVMPFLEAKPEIWDLLKDDSIFHELLSGGGMPEKHMRTQAEVADIRQARAEQQQQMQQSQLAKEAAQAYKDGSYQAEEGSLSKGMMNGQL